MGIKELLKKEITQQDLLNYFNANIPSEIYGCVFNYDDINFILINKNLSNYKKKKTILHELAHIELAQLEQRDKDLFALHTEQYEDEADKYVKKILSEIKEKILA